ncbi:MAG: histidine phosphatase family protein [Pseudomonadota bacterium]|nr:histidine phosphatase family protein [Pseudomonadota bacterium]
MTGSFWFVRHGESEANRDGIRSGQMDTPLTDLGRRQALDLVPALAPLDPAPQRLVTSTLSRARETAQIINRHLDLPVSEEAGLCEQHYGECQGQKIKTVIARHGPDWVLQPPGGETFEDFGLRIVRTLETILFADAALPLIVGHGGMINVLRHRFGLPYEKVTNCAVFFFKAQETGDAISWKIREQHPDQSVIDPGGPV